MLYKYPLKPGQLYSRITIPLDEWLNDWIEKLADENNVTRSELVRSILKEHIITTQMGFEPKPLWRRFCDKLRFRD